MNFATRNTIPWRLDCELEGEDRAFGLKQFGLSMEQDKTISDTLTVNVMIAYILIGFSTFLVCCMSGTGMLCHPAGSQACMPLGVSVAVRILVIIVASMQLHTLNKIGKVTARNIDKLESNRQYSNVDCSDEFSRVDVGPAIDQMEESNALLGGAYALTIAAYLWIVLELFLWKCYCKGKLYPEIQVNHSDDDDDDFHGFHHELERLSTNNDDDDF